mgnify:CR=1 FL=1
MRTEGSTGGYGEVVGCSVIDLRFLCIGNVIAGDRHYLDVEFAGDIGDQEPYIDRQSSL